MNIDKKAKLLKLVKSYGTWYAMYRETLGNEEFKTLNDYEVFQNIADEKYQEIIDLIAEIE